MADQANSANWNAEVPQLGMQALWRLAIWGGAAILALFVAVMSAFSSAGSQRQTAAITSGQVASDPATAGQGTVQPRIPSGEFGPQPGETTEETQRLAEAVRALTADRDQALARIAALERNLDGITGTIKRDRIASPLPTPSQPPLQNPSPAAGSAPPARLETPAARPETPAARPEMPAAPVMEAAIIPASTPAVQQSGPGAAAPTAAPDTSNRAAASPSNLVRVSALAEPLAAAAGLGVDIGGAINYAGLRTLWHSTRSSEPELPDELYPVVTVRENGKTHGIELRLVVGPIADVEAAARLCATLLAAHHYCQPVAFEGQRLSQIDTAPPKAVPARSHRSAPSPLGFQTVPESPSQTRLITGK
jgi:hypothetical protein